MFSKVDWFYSMRMNFPKSSRTIAIAAATGLLLGVTVTVVGSPRLIAGSTAATYYVCVKNSTGVMRMVSASKACTKGEKRWQWKGTGVQGPTGPTGPTGPPGPPGTGITVVDSLDHVLGTYTGTFSTVATDYMTYPTVYESAGYTMVIDGVEVRIGEKDGKVRFFKTNGDYYRANLYFDATDCTGTPSVDKDPYDLYGAISIKLVDDGSVGTRSYHRVGDSVTPSRFGSTIINGQCFLSGEAGREVYPVALDDAGTIYSVPIRIVN